MEESQDLQEPLKKRVGGSLARLHPFDRVAMLQRNADALLGPTWRGKDDGTLVRKVVGKAPRR
jgi:hypothetical protein